MLIYNSCMLVYILVYIFVNDVLPDHRAEIEIPDSAVRAFARVILPDIIEMLSTEEGRRTLEQWRLEEEEKEKKKQEAQSKCRRSEPSKD